MYLLTQQLCVFLQGPIVYMTGMTDATVGSLIDFESPNKDGGILRGVIMELERNVAKAAVLGNVIDLKIGDEVKLAPALSGTHASDGSREFTFPAGADMLGKVVDVLGRYVLLPQYLLLFDLFFIH